MNELNKKRRWIATPISSARNDEETETTRCQTKTFGHDRRGGFTLVELVIVIAIVIILSVVSVPIYRGYTNQAKMAEGYALLGTIFSSQKAYYSQYGCFLHWSNSSAGSNIYTSTDFVLGIDARSNKYFTCFDIGDKFDSTRSTYWFKAKAVVPEELRSIVGKSFLVLEYNITLSGATLLSDN